MIYEVEGDILLTQSPVIAHGVCGNDPMNKGLALALHKHYPAMHKDFHHFCHTRNPKPGEAWMWGTVNGKRVVNLITREDGPGHATKPGKASLKAVRQCLKNLHEVAIAEGFSSLALPRLATGAGGLDWDDVKPLIFEQLGDSKIPIFLYSTYHAGQAAKEPKL